MIKYLKKENIQINNIDKVSKQVLENLKRLCLTANISKLMFELQQIILIIFRIKYPEIKSVDQLLKLRIENDIKMKHPSVLFKKK